MMRLLGTVVALLLTLTGCGSAGGSAQGAGAQSPAATPQLSYDVVALVSGSAARGPGVKGTRPVVVTDQAALNRYAGQFEGPLPSSLKSQGGQALADLPDGRVLTATVVAVGCEPPTTVTVTHAGGSVNVAAVPVKSNIQCLVPVTTVALVSVPSAFAAG